MAPISPTPTHTLPKRSRLEQPGKDSVVAAPSLWERNTDGGGGGGGRSGNGRGGGDGGGGGNDGGGNDGFGRRNGGGRREGNGGNGGGRGDGNGRGANGGFRSGGGGRGSSRGDSDGNRSSGGRSSNGNRSGDGNGSRGGDSNGGGDNNNGGGGGGRSNNGKNNGSGGRDGGGGGGGGNRNFNGDRNRDGNRDGNNNDNNLENDNINGDENNGDPNDNGNNDGNNNGDAEPELQQTQNQAVPDTQEPGDQQQQEGPPPAGVPPVPAEPEAALDALPPLAGAPAIPLLDDPRKELGSVVGADIPGLQPEALPQNDASLTGSAVTEPLAVATDSNVVDDNDNNNDNNNGNGNNRDRNRKDRDWRDRRKGRNRNGKDEVGERALIAGGSIGTFIAVCFFCWIVWRTIKRRRTRKRKGSETSSIYSNPPIGSRAVVGRTLGKIPWFKNRPWVQNWQRLADPVESPFPPVYEKAVPMDQIPQVPVAGSPGAYYIPSYAMKPTLMTNIPMGTAPGTGGISPTGGVAISPTLVGTLPMMMNGQVVMPPLDTNMAATMAANNMGQSVTVSPTSTMLQRSNTVNTMNTMNTMVSMVPNMGTMAGFGHQANPSLSSVTAQYGGTLGGMAAAGGTMPPYYNQSELARQPSDAYDPTRRQVNRISELSSLSSGFGDGDIFMPGTAFAAQDAQGNLLPRPPPPATQALRSSQNFVGRAAPSSSSGDGSSPRDTVYTEKSEDSPPRFRTINSWVNQQTGRIQRAQRRVFPGDGGGSDGSGSSDGGDGHKPPGPGLPAGHGVNGIPPEPQLNMMMPDGEVPRRVDINMT